MSSEFHILVRWNYIRFNDSTRIEEALKYEDIDNYNDILGYAPIQKIVWGGGWAGGSEGYLCLPEGS